MFKTNKKRRSKSGTPFTIMPLTTETVLLLEHPDA